MFQFLLHSVSYTPVYTISVYRKIAHTGPYAVMRPVTRLEIESLIPVSNIYPFSFVYHGQYLPHVLLYLPASITLGGYATGEVSREQTTTVCFQPTPRFVSVSCCSSMLILIFVCFSPWAKSITNNY